MKRKTKTEKTQNEGIKTKKNGSKQIASTREKNNNEGGE